MRSRLSSSDLSVHSIGVASVASAYGSVLSEVGSVVSNIQKSSMFKEVTDAGLIRLHLPIDNVRLMIDPDLETGMVYKDVAYTNEEEEDEEFERYHENDPDWDDSAIAFDAGTDGGGCKCHCHCDFCAGCTDKNKLKPFRYAIAVDPDLYKRVLSEIADARDMPCGLYFCGHHEDVSRPSVKIAVTIVVVLFVLMFLGTEMYS